MPEEATSTAPVPQGAKPLQLQRKHAFKRPAAAVPVCDEDDKMSDAEVGHPTNPSKRVAHNEPLASDVSLHIGERGGVEPTEQLASDARLHIGAPDQVAPVEQLASEASLHIGAEVGAQPHHDAESGLEVYLRGLDQWMLPGDDVKGRKSWIIKTWPG